MGSPQINSVLQSYTEAWRPPPRLQVSDWAGGYRYLSPEASAEPGLWNNARAPHLVAPMDRLSPYCDTERVVCKFASQTGKTEAILNFCGYVVDCDPGPMLAVQPNVKPMGEAFSKDRISPMFRDSPTLLAKVGKAKSRASASTVTHKTFPNGHLTVVGANSAAGLSSRPIRYLVADELDRWEMTKEGDPLFLARKRLQTFRVRRQSKELIVSSPTYSDIGICVEYDKCSQQHEWHLECLHCGETQLPRLKHFQYDESPGSVRYACEHCGAEHPLSQADRVKSCGRWVCVKDEGEQSVGYTMNQWASPFARWDDTVEEWLAAGTDSAQRQAVTNTAFCEPWEGEGERIDPHALMAREEDYPADAPAGVRAVTIGVDLQKDRAEVEVVGWGMNHESWSIAYEVLPGDPTGTELWEDLADFFKQTWAHESGAALSPTAICIDSGNWTHQTYEFVKAQRNARIIPIKGASAFGADVLSGTKKDRRRKAMKRAQDGRPPEILGVSKIKRTIAQYLAAKPGSPGYCHFPADRGREYYDQLTGERLVVSKRRGKRPQLSWIAVHPNVEALDCRVYAFAALLLTDPDLSREIKPPERKGKREKTPTARTRSNFVNKW